MLTIPSDMFKSDKTEQKQEAQENHDDSTQQDCNSYVPDLSALAEVVNVNETDIPDIFELVRVDFVHQNCHQSVTIIGRPN